jgi:hypothetical protein
MEQQIQNPAYVPNVHSHMTEMKHSDSNNYIAYCMKIMVRKFFRSILDACFLSAVPVLTDLYLMGWVDSLSQQVLYIKNRILFSTS